MIMDILVTLLSSIIGVSSISLSKLFRKNFILKEDKKQTKVLSSRLDKLTRLLKESSDLMQEIELEFEKQKELAEEWKKQADTSIIIASMNQQEIEAVTKIFGRQIENESKKTNKRSLIQSAIFCIIGLIGGYFISRYFL